VVNHRSYAGLDYFASDKIAASMPSPLVSIITLSYNYGRYVGQAIESVLAQTYPHWELVVVDDASEDDSLDVVRRFDDPRIVVLPLSTHQGAAAAYNAAYARCRGKYLGTVDADDQYLPDKLARQVGLFESRPDLDIAGTWIVQIDAEGLETAGFNEAACNRPRDLNALDSWAGVDLLNHSSALIRKAAHDRVGGLNPQLDLAPDYELWLRFLTHGARFEVIPERLTKYRSHAANVSHTYDRREIWLQLCFLYAVHFAPLAVRRGRQDLLDHAWQRISSLVAEGGPGFRTFAFRRLAAFPLLSADYGTFRRRLLDEIEASQADAWSRVSRQPTPGRSVAASVRTTPAAPRLAIVDDFFPSLMTGFRIAEFNWYLEHLDCVVYSTNPDFTRVWADYAAVYPHLADRVRPFEASEAARSQLLYCVFLNNAFTALPLAEAHGLSLVFTLYPGGRFEFFSRHSDFMLSRLAHSPALRRIIVNQHATRDYLLEGGFLDPDRIQVIWGLPCQTAMAGAPLPKRPHWPAEKDTLDLCFAAYKYMSGGIDKGYDTFITAARRLASLDESFRFHVAGTFGPGDADLGGLGSRITFHGSQPAHQLAQFFAGMDMILSPNVRFRLSPGGFDGFPTGTCTEAALAGVVVLCTDPSGEHSRSPFVPGEDLCIVDANADAFVDTVMALRADPERLYAIGARGQARSREIYRQEGQLAPRMAVLSEYLERPIASAVMAS
jgi:glycosyltransferase involved in cell wall biosynthesis